MSDAHFDSRLPPTRFRFVSYADWEPYTVEELRGKRMGIVGDGPLGLPHAMLQQPAHIPKAVSHPRILLSAKKPHLQRVRCRLR